MPDPANNQVIGVFDTTAGLTQGFNMQNFDGAMVIDWGDGTVENVPNGWAVNDHTYAAGTGTATANGSTQVKITVTAPATRGHIEFSYRTKIIALKYGSDISPAYSFSNCIMLHYVKFFGAVPAVIFDSCYNLRIFDTAVPMTTVPVKFLQNCYSLYKIDLSQVTTFGDYAFDCCFALKNIDISKAVTIGNGAFKNCYSLKDINAALVTSIGDYAFLDCHKLLHFIAPVLTRTGTYALSNCYSLLTITYADGCTFGSNAFVNCPMLYPIPT